MKAGDLKYKNQNGDKVISDADRVILGKALPDFFRTRSNLSNLTLADATSKDVFRDLILRERGWEFISEGLRREDLIRHGKFISLATGRGLNAKAHQVAFPIPQGEIDANKAAVQTTGY